MGRHRRSLSPPLPLVAGPSHAVPPLFFPLPPFLRGEGRGEGTLREFGPWGEPPHPDLLPACGEKEKTLLPHAIDLPVVGREKGHRPQTRRRLLAPAPPPRATAPDRRPSAR